MHKQLTEKKAKLAVIGLGYVGLPLALAFSRIISVIGFDIDKTRIAQLQKRFDSNQEWEPDAFDGCDIVFTEAPGILQEAIFFIIAVPTLVDRHNVPDLKALAAASETVGKALKKGDYVVYESTTYPGCTEDYCVPILQRFSGLGAVDDFKFGYSPERINPGDRKNTLHSIVKIVSGCDGDTAGEISRVYRLVVEAGIYQASSIRIAEAAKIVENTQRDLNIAFMNELSMIFDTLAINTYEVLEAAGTKWNFLKFQPGLVGGHCIGIDPYYLTHTAVAAGYDPKVVSSSRFVNDAMAKYVARKIVTHVLKTSPAPKVLVMGITFKENVSDIRNSKIVDTVRELLAFHIRVDIEDPYASGENVLKEFGLELVKQRASDYDAVIVTVAHRSYEQLDDAFFSSITREHALVADLKGIYRNKIFNRKYWSL